MLPKACIAGGVIILLFSAEFSFWLGSTNAQASPPEGTCGVLVLGYPSRSDGLLSAEQRDRVETAVSVALTYKCDPVVISGGSVHNEFSEAATMALQAVKLGLPRKSIRLEEKATSTIENVRFSAPKLEGVGTIYIVSNGLHAHRGVRDFCREVPNRCGQVRPAARYYPFRRYFLKFPAALHEGLARLKSSFT